MNTPSKEWLRFMREQYPVGSRIKLREMKDPYAPVEPGTMGTLTAIDDLGTFHCKWDNGRGLGLIMGEDSFTVLPPETHTLKLYMPMTIDYYERNEWGDMENDPCEMCDFEAAKYADNIAAALLWERCPKEAERGLMTYYRGNDGVNRKVKSYEFTAEARNGKLWGVAKCQVHGKLTPAEMELLKEDITGQASDGFGESFERREIKTANGLELYAHLWQCDNWSIKTEQEAFALKLAEGFQQIGGMTLG